MKISYHASAQKISVLEHFVNAMIKTYTEIQNMALGMSQQIALLNLDILSGSKIISEGTPMIKSSLKIMTSETDQRGLIALTQVFKPQMKGIAKLKAIKNMLVYQREKFKKYLANEWEFGKNPCSKIPLELQVGSYP